MRRIIILAFLLFFSFNVIKATSFGFGGHDLFTSLAQLEVLWKNDRQIVSKMQAAIERRREDSPEVIPALRT